MAKRKKSGVDREIAKRRAVEARAIETGRPPRLPVSQRLQAYAERFGCSRAYLVAWGAEWLLMQPSDLVHALDEGWVPDFVHEGQGDAPAQGPAAAERKAQPAPLQPAPERSAADLRARSGSLADRSRRNHAAQDLRRAVALIEKRRQALEEAMSRRDAAAFEMHRLGVPWPRIEVMAGVSRVAIKKRLSKRDTP